MPAALTLDWARGSPESLGENAVASQKQRLHGLHCVREALRAERREIHRFLLRPGRRGPAVSAILERVEERGIPIADLAVPPSGSDSEWGNDQGVALEVGPLPEYGLHELLSLDPRGKHRRIVALDRVEDPQNVGSIIRIAEAAGIDGILLTRRRAPPLGPAVARASSGAVEWLPVSRVSNLGNALKGLKEKGFWAVGADPSGDESLFDLPDRFFQAHLVIVMGAEGPGLRTGVHRHLDHRLRIPLTGRVASLNVASAAALLVFEAQRRANPKSA